MINEQLRINNEEFRAGFTFNSQFSIRNEGQASPVTDCIGGDEIHELPEPKALQTVNYELRITHCELTKRRYSQRIARVCCQSSQP